MIRQIYKTIILIIILIVVSCSSVQAYSDDIFEFDLPESYGQLSYQTMYLFTDSNNSDRGMVIYAKQYSGLKKSVWDIEQSDLDTMIRSISSSSNIISTNKKAKLGKEKAIKIILKEDEQYMELYLLASNNYIYSVVFTGTSLEELENSDYEMIKDSFKLKDSSTDPKIIYLIAIIIAIGIWVFRNMRKSKNKNNNDITSNPYSQVDYKNLTEEDLK